MNFDVLIIGSGPAGTAAAIKCASHGLKVIVLTKAPERLKPQSHYPSQSIHPGVMTLLKDLQLEDAALLSSYSKFKGIWVKETYQPLNREDDHWEGYHINRSAFNLNLYSRLVQENIPIVEGEIHEINKEGDLQIVHYNDSTEKIISTKFILDASGKSRKMGRLLKLNEIFLSRPMTVYTGVSSYDGLSMSKQKTSFLPDTNGWTWIANDDQNKFTWTKLIIDKKEKFKVPFGTHNVLSKTYTYNVRWRVYRPIFKDNVLLCGDAAGMLDPSTGQGILNGLMSGIMAAQCIYASIYQPTFSDLYLAQYDQWLISQFENKATKLNDYYFDQLHVNVNSVLHNTHMI